eukprot:s984_g15.t1
MALPADASDSPTASEAEAMKQELLMQELTDCLPVPHRGMQFLLDNIGSCSLEVLRELLTDFTEAENTAVTMRKAITDCIEKLEGDQQGKPYTVFVWATGEKVILLIDDNDTAESILTKYQEKRDIPFTDPVIIGCDIEDKNSGWTVRMKSVFSEFETDNLAEGGYGLYILPREDYSYMAYEANIETSSVEDNSEPDTSPEARVLRDTSPDASDMLKALCEKETGNTIDINTKGGATKPLKMEVQTVGGCVKLVFHYVVGETGENLFKALTEFGLDATLFQVKFAGTASVLQGYDSLEAYSDQTFQIVPLLSGGGKRAKAPKGDDATMPKNPKELKAKVQGNLAQLKALTPTPALTQNIIAQIESILNDTATDPSGTASAMIDQVPKETLCIIIANLLSSSPRPEGKIDYIMSQAMPRMVESTEELIAHATLAKHTLALALQYAVNLEFEDGGRGIAWQGLIKVMTAKATSTAPDASDERACAVM